MGNRSFEHRYGIVSDGTTLWANASVFAFNFSASVIGGPAVLSVDETSTRANLFTISMLVALGFLIVAATSNRKKG